MSNLSGKTKFSNIININEKKIALIFNEYKNDPLATNRYWKPLADACKNRSHDKINKLITYLFLDCFGLSVPCFIKISHELNQKFDFDEIRWEIDNPTSSNGVGEIQTYW